jgi:hypothetical protein
VVGLYVKCMMMSGGGGEAKSVMVTSDWIEQPTSRLQLAGEARLRMMLQSSALPTELQSPELICFMKTDEAI